MRKRTAVAAAALLALGPASASAMGPAEEMTQQMHEWTRYERPAFAPVEVQVDGATLTLLDATMESHPLEEYLFAFSQGSMWASLWEHLFWHGAVPDKPPGHPSQPA
ncbi:MAG: hypothetical protein ACE5H5_01965 [Nitrospinota bacterium]